VEIPEKVEIESEWAEWQTGIVEQQAYAEIEPRPGKDDEDDHYDDSGWLRDPSFIGPAMQGRAPPRSDASSPKSGAPIGAWPPALPPPRPEADFFFFYIRLDFAELWNCLTTNTAI